MVAVRLFMREQAKQFFKRMFATPFTRPLKSGRTPTIQSYENVDENDAQEHVMNILNFPPLEMV